MAEFVNAELREREPAVLENRCDGCSREKPRPCRLLRGAWLDCSGHGWSTEGIAGLLSAQLVCSGYGWSAQDMAGHLQPFSFKPLDFTRVLIFGPTFYSLLLP